MTEIISFNFLHRIRNLLSTADYIDMSKDLVVANLDNRVAAGSKVLDLMLNRLKSTIAVLEPVVEKTKGKGKSKSVHIVGSQEDCTPPENRNMERPHVDRCEWNECTGLRIEFFSFCDLFIVIRQMFTSYPLLRLESCWTLTFRSLQDNNALYVAGLAQIAESSPFETV